MKEIVAQDRADDKDLKNSVEHIDDLNDEVEKYNVVAQISTEAWRASEQESNKRVLLAAWCISSVIVDVLIDVLYHICHVVVLLIKFVRGFI